MKPLLLIALAIALPTARAQWKLLDAHTTADLSGIDNAGNGVAWASGANGTVLRTQDGGHAWQVCAVPPNADKLDFHSIQALSASTAIVMSTGKGEASRVYKTTDGCQTWKMVFENPNAKSSFDALHRVSAFQMYLLGDPVDGKFALYESADGGNTWTRSSESGLDLPKGVESLTGSTGFTNVGFLMAFGTGGKQASVYTFSPVCGNTTGVCVLAWTARATPIANAASTVGVFSLAGRVTMVQATAPVTGIATMPATTLIAVGGSPAQPAQGGASAAFSNDDGLTWKPAATPPRGFRSAVAFDPDRSRFIAVGPNGTDVSIDDGNDWFALKPGPGQDPEADQHWTALSMPFVVGPHGRIGMLSTDLPTTRIAAATR